MNTSVSGKPKINLTDKNSSHTADDSSEDHEDSVTSSEKGVKRTLEDGNTDHYPKALKEMFGALNCDLCGVVANSTLTAYSHYKGKAHQKKVNKYLRENNVDIPNKKIKNDFESTVCEVCDVILTSELQSLQHYSGKSHKKKMANRGDPKVKVNSESYDSSGRFGIGKSFLPTPVSTDITESESAPKGSKEQVHFCSVCSVFTNSLEALTAHMEGVKHQKKVSEEKASELNSLSKYRTPSGYYYCSSCDISANSADQFLIHMKSKKHTNNIKKKSNT